MAFIQKLMKSGRIPLVIFLGILLASNQTLSPGQKIGPGKTGKLKARNPKISSITIIQESGARPRFSPKEDLFVFDKKNRDGFYDVYVSDLNGNIVQSLTSGKTGLNQRHNGNAIFDPSGKFILFISEEEEHYGLQMKYLGDPGLGLYSNLWATDLEGHRFWKLTDIPIKKEWKDGIESVATINPLFSPDGSMLLWTERYAEGGNNNWGKWRIKAADYSSEHGKPSLRNERILLTPAQGNYITAMAFLDSEKLLVAGNLDGQHEYGMDQYLYNLSTHTCVNLTNTPEAWEEDSSLAPNGYVVYMTNKDSRYTFDFSRADWSRQPVERDYYLTDSNRGQPERLTFFNEPSAPEYYGKRILVAASDFNRDGRYLAGTMGVDYGKGNTRSNVTLKIILIELTEPFK